MLKWFVMLPAAAVTGGLAFSQDVAGASSITLSAGGETSLGTNLVGTGPAFNASYEFRLDKYFAVDAGQETWLPRGTVLVTAPVFPAANPAIFSPSGFAVVPVPARRLSTALHASVRGILPLAHDRLELFLGAGPGYAWNLSGSPLPSGFVVEFESGARYAIDKRKRFWIGASSQFFGNFSTNRQQWFATTADFGFRFGHK